MIDPKQMLEEEGIECLTPDLPDEIIGDINSSPSLAPYKAALLDHARAEAELALHRQNRIKEASDRIERCYMDGIGRRVASIDKKLFDRLCRVWGPKWFRDPDRLHRVLEENPAMAVKCEGWRPQDRFSTRMKRRIHVKTYKNQQDEQNQTNEISGTQSEGAGGNGHLQGDAVARRAPEVPADTTAGAPPFQTSGRPWAVDVMEAMA